MFYFPLGIDSDPFTRQLQVPQVEEYIKELKERFQGRKTSRRDMVLHLCSGPIPNASVHVVRGSRSVEVRAVGVTKGAASDRILGESIQGKYTTTPIDCVLVLDIFMDENVYTFFEPELPYDTIGLGRSKAMDGLKLFNDRRFVLKLPPKRSASKSSYTIKASYFLNPEKKNSGQPSVRKRKKAVAREDLRECG